MALEKVPEQQAEELGPERVVKLKEVGWLQEPGPEELGAAAARRELRAEVLPELEAGLWQGVEEVKVSFVLVPLHLELGAGLGSVVAELQAGSEPEVEIRSSP